MNSPRQRFPAAPSSLLAVLLTLPLSSLACGGRTDAVATDSTRTSVPPSDDGSATLLLPSGAIAVQTPTSLLFYPPDAVTHTAPLGVLDLSLGGFMPVSVAFDSAGYIYIDSVNEADGTNARLASRVDVFAPGSVGAAMPVRTIQGASTQLFDTRTMAIDASGFLYVASSGSGTLGDSGYVASGVAVFAPSATGNVAPVRVVTPLTIDGLWLPCGTAIDANGDLFVGDSEDSPLGVFSPSSNGPTTPLRTYGGFDLNDPTGLALDASGRIYISEWGSDDVRIFDADPTLPSVTLSGEDTQLASPTAIAVDHAGRIYVASSGLGAVLVFAPGSVGNTRPIAALVAPGASGLAVAP